MAGLDGGRLNIGACSVGGAQFCLDRTVDYMKERRQFGSRLADFQALQFRVADYATEIEAARLLLHRAAVAVGEGEPAATRLAAQAKRLATDTGFAVVNGCLQLHGGYGYLRDHPIERVLRDVRVHQILEGTNEIMRLIISRAMLETSNREGSMEQLPRLYLSRAEMEKRIARFKDLKGSDGGLPDSKMPGCERTLFNVIGFQPPENVGENATSPVGDHAAQHGCDQDPRGLQPRLLQGQARPRTGNAQSRYQRDIHPHDRHLAGELGR